MVKAVDSMGNYSTNAATVITNVPSILSMNFITSQDEATGGFLGTKTHLVIDGVVLKLDIESYEIDQEDGDAILTEVCGIRWRLLTEDGDDLTSEGADDLQQEEYEVPYGAGGDALFNEAARLAAAIEKRLQGCGIMAPDLPGQVRIGYGLYDGDISVFVGY